MLGKGSGKRQNCKTLYPCSWFSYPQNCKTQINSPWQEIIHLIKQIKMFIKNIAHGIRHALFNLSKHNGQERPCMKAINIKSAS